MLLDEIDNSQRMRRREAQRRSPSASDWTPRERRAECAAGAAGAFRARDAARDAGRALPMNGVFVAQSSKPEVSSSPHMLGPVVGKDEIARPVLPEGDRTRPRVEQ